MIIFRHLKSALRNIEALKQLEEMGFVAKNGFEKVLKAVQKHHAKDGIDLNAAIADLLQALKSA